MNNGCEIEIGDKKKKKKVFLLLEFDPVQIWIDISGLPPSAYLCACIDGTPFKKAKVGENGNITRYFVNIEWAINEWGGPKDIVNALKNRKEMTMQELPGLIKKYSELAQR